MSMADVCEHIWHPSPNVFYEQKNNDGRKANPRTTMICERCGERKTLPLGSEYNSDKYLTMIKQIDKHSNEVERKLKTGSDDKKADQ